MQRCLSRPRAWTQRTMSNGRDVVAVEGVAGAGVAAAGVEAADVATTLGWISTERTLPPDC